MLSSTPLELLQIVTAVNLCNSNLSGGIFSSNKVSVSYIGSGDIKFMVAPYSWIPRCLEFTVVLVH